MAVVHLAMCAFLSVAYIRFPVEISQEAGLAKAFSRVLGQSLPVVVDNSGHNWSVTYSNGERDIGTTCNLKSCAYVIAF